MPWKKDPMEGNASLPAGTVTFPFTDSYSVNGTGNQRTIAADVGWTFPLNFVEVVWGGGKSVDLS